MGAPKCTNRALRFSVMHGALSAAHIARSKLEGGQ